MTGAGKLRPLSGLRLAGCSAVYFEKDPAGPEAEREFPRSHAKDGAVWEVAAT